MEKPNPPKSKVRDVFAVHKNIGYRYALGAPKDEELSMESFVHFARFYICEARNLLFFDPILETYTDEQILTEYYAIRFSKDETFRKAYEAENGDDEDDVEWMDRQIAENKKNFPAQEPEEVLGEEGFEETPESLAKEDDNGTFD